VRKGKSQVRSVYGFALHHYAWNLSRVARKIGSKEKGRTPVRSLDWYELLREGQRMESMINNHWQATGRKDPDHSIKLVVDEWGPWYKPGSEATPGDLLEQMITCATPSLAAWTLDIFNRHPEKVTMANCAH